MQLFRKKRKEKMQDTSNKTLNLQDTLQTEVEKSVTFANTNNSSTAAPPPDKFRFFLEDLIAFCFPVELQHPLSTGLLYSFGYCGPLVDGKLRTGPKGSRTLMQYEVDQICEQYEREDLIQIYLHRASDMGMLTSTEQEDIIGQADGHLKKAKGKAMLPTVKRHEVTQILKNVNRDEWGRLCFHEAQVAIVKYRENRIKQFKLVYPNLGGDDSIGEIKEKTKFVPKVKKGGAVPGFVANQTMFQRALGNSNADLIYQTTSYLSKHAYKVNAFDQENSSSDVTANIRLLREIEPKFEDPYVKKNGQRVKPAWDSKSLCKGANIGSKVNSVPSSSTWVPKFTSY